MGKPNDQGVKGQLKARPRDPWMSEVGCDTCKVGRANALGPAFAGRREASVRLERIR